MVGGEKGASCVTNLRSRWEIGRRDAGRTASHLSRRRRALQPHDYRSRRLLELAEAPEIAGCPLQRATGPLLRYVAALRSRREIGRRDAGRTASHLSHRRCALQPPYHRSRRLLELAEAPKIAGCRLQRATGPWLRYVAALRPRWEIGRRDADRMASHLSRRHRALQPPHHRSRWLLEPAEAPKTAGCRLQRATGLMAEPRVA